VFCILFDNIRLLWHNQLDDECVFVFVCVYICIYNIYLPCSTFYRLFGSESQYNLNHL